MKATEVCSCEAEIRINVDTMDEVIALLQQWRDHHSRNCPDNRVSPRGGRTTNAWDFNPVAFPGGTISSA